MVKVQVTNSITSIGSILAPESLKGDGNFESQAHQNRNQKSLKNKSRSLTLANCNPYIKTFKAMEYAARGPVIMRAMQIEIELAQGIPKPFTTVIKANLGDAHAMGQKPITFLRQVLALVSCPSLIPTCDFPSDVREKALRILSDCRGGSVGSYSDSRGMDVTRRHVAKYIQRRDVTLQESNPDDIVLCAGASEGIRACLKLFKSGGDEKRGGVLVPVPEYPLYSATLGEYDLDKIPYYLEESHNWAITEEELDRVIKISKKECKPRAIVVINPGNPTGHVLSRENIEEIIRFAYKEGLVVLADEVYQDNVYAPATFHSFRKVLLEMSAPFNSVELVSFYSCSKGYICECGLRGGYFELVNFDADVKSILLASVAAKLCPTVLGQTAVECAVSPPEENDPSFPLFSKERSEILNNLEERAKLVTQAFNSMEGFSCSPIRGAMYAFPQVTLSEKAIAAARLAGQEPDVFYCLQLLDATGVCVVPGSGIGQLPGTFHFRTTILASTENLSRMLDSISHFHRQFTQNYSG